MALLSGTNPECDKPRWEYRFNVGRRWDCFGLRSPVVASIEVRDRLSFSAVFPDEPIWEPIARTGLVEYADVSRLLKIAIETDDPVERKAKLIAIVNVGASSVALVIRGLMSPADRTIRVASEMRADATNALEVQRGELESKLRAAYLKIGEMTSDGCRSRTITTADGAEADRGDSVFLGTEPERRLILIDSTEALCAESRKVIGLPDGVPVFSKRDRARAWKRSKRTPLSSPCQSGTARGDAMPTASVGGTTDGASSLGRDGTELFPEVC